MKVYLIYNKKDGKVAVVSISKEDRDKELRGMKIAYPQFQWGKANRTIKDGTDPKMLKPVKP